MSLKFYTNNIPDEILEQLKKSYLISNKEQIVALYVYTFFGKIREAHILTDEKVTCWSTKINNSIEKKVISLKKIKDITYSEKGIYGTITYHLSMNKTFDLKLDRKDGEKFYKFCLETWEKTKEST
ncbi:MAG: hypothetical protein GXW85_08025 [Clostridia bacterium]|nr:hypothetical protein [Clostridia bacterium]